VRDLTVFSSEYKGNQCQTKANGFIITILGTVSLSLVGAESSVVGGSEEGVSEDKG
jgi:hypothetical protein